ncbi:MAG TPA: S41 family peptidase, partial [Pyrinomonadaceae bacterium]
MRAQTRQFRRSSSSGISRPGYLLLCLFLLIQPVRAQIQNEIVSTADAKTNRSRGLKILEDIKEVIKKEYYDPTFHGINLDERFKVAAERIKKLNANWQIFRVIAQVLLDFNDSHTRFSPPPRALRLEYGFSMQMIGNDCYVVAVKKGSDAEAKGIKAGDIVLKISGYTPTRANFSTILYLIYQLHPQEKLALGLRSDDGTERQTVVDAKLRTGEEVAKERAKRKSDKKETPFKCKEVSAETIACKLYTFSVEKNQIDKMMKEVRKYKKLILDLRGNGGGYITTEMYLTGYFFDRDVKIGDIVRRKKVEEQIAKGLKEKFFSGDLIVLIDSNSASASEVFARVIQLEKRGRVVGDVSAGAVMTSYFFPFTEGRGDWSSSTWWYFGINVTIGDLIMSDGKRLENVGVIPDRPVGPTASALLQRDDPTLAYAAALFGTKLTPEQARDFHFITYRYEAEVDQDD